MVNWVDGIVNTVGFVSASVMTEHINMVQWQHNFTIDPDEGLYSKRMDSAMSSVVRNSPSG